MDIEFKTPLELYNWMHKNLKYKHTGKFLSVKEVYNNRYGDCHDQANFEIYFLKKMNLKCGRIFMIEYSTWDSPGGATHTLAYYIQNNKYYWIENAWEAQAGIHGPYKSINELKDLIASKWQYSGKNDKLYMGEYKSVKFGASLNDYVITNTPENNPKSYYSKNDSLNAKSLEAFLIPIQEGFFGTSSKDISEGEMKRSPYCKMSDRDLATTLVDRLYNNRNIKLADKADTMVMKYLNIMKITAYDYFEYNISGIPVAVSRINKNKEPSFTVYAYVMGSSSPTPISTYRNELIKNFIIEDKRKRGN